MMNLDDIDVWRSGTFITTSRGNLMKIGKKIRGSDFKFRFVELIEAGLPDLIDVGNIFMELKNEKETFILCIPVSATSINKDLVRDMFEGIIGEDSYAG